MEVAAQACERFEADAETEALCAACRWPVHFHTPSSPSSAQEAPSPRKASPRLSQTPMRSSGVWGARPSEGLQKRGSAVLSSTRVSLPPSKPLPVPAAVASPKEVAATLRRVVKLELVEQDGAEYSCASGADMVLALMHHRKVSRSDAIETGRLLLSSGYLASVGTRGGFADAQDRYFSFVVLPELASVGRSLEHGTVAWDQQPSAELRPFEDVRTLVATVLGCAWRFDYRTTSPYAAYFVHVAEGEQSGITVTRRFADCSELHRLLSKK